MQVQTTLKLCAQHTSLFHLKARYSLELLYCQALYTNAQASLPATTHHLPTGNSTQDFQSIL